MPSEPRQTAHVPVPDPTELTTRAMLREIQMLRDLLEARLNGYDKAILLLQNEADKVPSKVDIEVSHLQELHEARFGAMDLRFSDRDVRFNESAQNNRTEVAAALAAAKEAVAVQNLNNMNNVSKMEAVFTKQIEQISTLIGTISKATDERINDIKERLISLETRKNDAKEVGGYIIGGAGLLIAAAALAVSFFMRK